MEEKKNISEQTMITSEKKPLSGKIYAVPYVEGCSFDFSTGWKELNYSILAEMLEKLGAETISIPVGRIEPRGFDTFIIPVIAEGDFFVFSDKNAVNAFMCALKEERIDIRSFNKAGIAAVDKETAMELARFGIIADILSEKGTEEDLGTLLSFYLLHCSKIFWFTGNESRKSFPIVLTEKCELSKQICYENIIVNTCITEEEIEAIKRSDGIFFTGGSDVERALSLIGTDNIPEKVYSIGPVCSKTIESLGLEIYEEAEDPSYFGMIKLLAQV